jgi:hypothetical protein
MLENKPQDMKFPIFCNNSRDASDILLRWFLECRDHGIRLKPFIVVNDDTQETRPNTGEEDGDDNTRRQANITNTTTSVTPQSSNHSPVITLDIPSHNTVNNVSANNSMQSTSQARTPESSKESNEKSITKANTHLPIQSTSNTPIPIPPVSRPTIGIKSPRITGTMDRFKHTARPTVGVKVPRIAPTVGGKEPRKRPRPIETNRSSDTVEPEKKKQKQDDSKKKRLSLDSSDDDDYIDGEEREEEKQIKKKATHSV